MAFSLILVVAAAAMPVAVPQLTLAQAVAEAEARAPAIEAAKAERDAAGARTVQARAAALPTATLSGTIGSGRLDPGGFFGLPAANVSPRAANVVIEQPLFTGGRTGAGLARAKAGERVAGAAVDGVRANLAAQVADAYGAVLVAEGQGRLYAALVDLTGELARHARERFETGDAPHTDLSQALSRLAEARAGLAGAGGLIVSARAHLASLIGHEPGALAPLPPPPGVPASREEAIGLAEQSSPALAEANATLDAATAGERGARAEQLPTLGAFAEASSVRDQFFPGYRGDGATIGVRARWQFFSGGRVRGAISEASAEVRAALARRNAARDQVREAVIAAHSAVQTGGLVAQAADEQQAAAEEAARNVAAEVKVGQRPQVDQLDAAREATAAGIRALQAHADQVAAAYRLNALIGRY